MSRTEIRELAFKLVYSLEIQAIDNLDEQINLYLENNQITGKEAVEYIKDVMFGINEHSSEIQEIIKSCLATGWSIERISKINISILKLSLYEIKYKNIPFKAEINEAVELAKKYGEDTSSKFINGALASAVKQLNIEN